MFVLMDPLIKRLFFFYTHIYAIQLFSTRIGATIHSPRNVFPHIWRNYSFCVMLLKITVGPLMRLIGNRITNTFQNKYIAAVRGRAPKIYRYPIRRVIENRVLYHIRSRRLRCLSLITRVWKIANFRHYIILIR